MSFFCGNGVFLNSCHKNAPTFGGVFMAGNPEYGLSWLTMSADDTLFLKWVLLFLDLFYIVARRCFGIVVVKMH